MLMDIRRSSFGFVAECLSVSEAPQLGPCLPRDRDGAVGSECGAGQGLSGVPAAEATCLLPSALPTA